MPLYFSMFKTELRPRIRPGRSFLDKRAAWAEATKSCGDLIRNIDGDLRPGHEWRMEVTDEFANPIYVIHINAENK
jgi:hypothetical protein